MHCAKHVSQETATQQLIEHPAKTSLKSPRHPGIQGTATESNWADVERTVGIGESRRKQFIALLNLPENIQKDIVATGRKPSKNQITEKHARALLLLNAFPEKQLELFELIKTSPEPIAGDAAISQAKKLKAKKLSIISV